MSKHATVHQIVAGMALLNEHIIQMDDGCAYAPGWSDERVSVEIGMNHLALVRLRRKAFGGFAHLKQARRDKGGRPKGATNAEIMRKIDHALGLMADINVKLDDLLRSLS